MTPSPDEHADHHCLSGSICEGLGLCVLQDGAETIKRLRAAAAAALERTQVGDAEEATAILEAVVHLDGSLKR